MTCRVCGMPVVAGDASCGYCGARVAGARHPVPTWIESALGMLPQGVSDAPSTAFLYLAAIPIAVLAWSFAIGPLLSLPSDSDVMLGLGALLDLDDAEIGGLVANLQDVFFQHVVNVISLGLMLWLVAFSLMRCIAVIWWRQMHRRARAHLSDYLSSAEEFHPGRALAGWVADPTRPGAANGVLREFFEELAMHQGDLAIRFEQRTDLVLQATERASTIARVGVWAIPIVGFIGTVIGISEAIARFSEFSVSDVAAASDGSLMAQFETTMGAVMEGLGTAFNTTLVALVLVLPVAFLVEAAGAFDESVRGSERLILFRRLWLYLAPTWRAETDVQDVSASGAAAVEVAAEVRNLARQLEAMGVRISSVRGLLGDLGQEVGRLGYLIGSLELSADEREDGTSRPPTGGGT